ncbi:DUF4846 domain-containing protein [Hymenobacter sp. 5317J-9]|uniref:DUF4846 domain-containing protein n=1 Tax=Hymenobacter sp. 5317J-9 TaxID=2932250 RepID=UPI001FD6344E|nr:DUF4846 domain-containing protein [Hymenobacter sp. 5317J-9]UOQ99804.1 DUF4846 domain-containing protein [Hymenobacter sp. 5317J-9]
MLLSRLLLPLALPFLLVEAGPAPVGRPAGLSYPWLNKPGAASQSLAARFPAPAGCRRAPVAAGSWGEWLRYLPLKPAGTKARLYNGALKNRQEVVAAVLDIDVGTKDLQQCADAVIRLRAEYLFSQNPNQIHFHLTTGYDFWFSDFVAGKTFRVVNEQVLPATRPAEALTHAALGRYLLPTFGYAGTLSLSRELRPTPLAAVQPGDVLIHGGAPGHAVLVVDVAENPATHQQYVLLAQSYMPAQNIHLLRNVDAPALGAWFAVPGPAAAEFDTPEWTFGRRELGRF